MKKVVLAYSGGLDTSVILSWLQETYRCEVVTFTADLGQGEELEPARKKAELMGVKEIFIDDLREEFVRDFVFPMFRANALYEGAVSARHLDRAAADRQAPDRDRRARSAPTRSRTAPPARATTRCASSSPITRSKPDIKVIAPWREWDFDLAHRADRVRREAPDPDPADKRGEAPFSVDANLLHISSEGKVLEDPWSRARRVCLSAHRRARGGAGPAASMSRSSSSTATRSRSTARRCRRRRCSRGSTSSAASTASAGSIWSRTASSA